MKRGQKAIIRVAVFPGREFSGTVSVVNQAADPLTRKFCVEVAADNPGLVLRPGTFGDVIFEVVSHEDTLALPQNAILENAYVFIVQDGKDITGSHPDTVQRLLSRDSVLVAPGDTLWISPHFGKQRGADPEKAFAAIVKKRIPLGRPQTLDDIAQAVLFLSRSRNITGCSLTVDGGYTML